MIENSLAHQLIFEEKTLEWALSGQCNDNNNGDFDAKTYIATVKRTHRDNWKDLFRTGGIIHTLTNLDRKILEEVSKVSVLTGKEPTNPETIEELNIIASKFPPIHGNVFVRFSDCSPKDGIGGPGPFTNAQDIIKCIITSKRSMLPLQTAGPVNLYIDEWNPHWKPENEFRVFVDKEIVTAISQYIWHKYCGFTRETIEIISKEIIKFCYKIMPKIRTFTTSCIVDVIWCDDHVELIEFNSFGAEMSSGSALFHWINDRDKLYLHDSSIYIRWVGESD